MRASFCVACVVGGRERSRERNDARDVLGAGAAFPFVAAAFDQRHQWHAAADDERAHTLGPAELVAGDRDEIHPHDVLAQVEPLRRLDRVGVDDRMRGTRAHEAHDVGEWLHDPGLVVHEHHRNDRSALIECRRERVEIDYPVGTGADTSDAEPVVLEARRGAEDRLVLDLRRDDAVEARPFARGPRRALHREVVGFAAAAGEHDLGRCRAATLGDVLARFFQRGLRCTRHAVRARRVPGMLREERQHRLDRFRPHRRRRRMIQVHQHAGQGIPLLLTTRRLWMMRSTNVPLATIRTMAG